MSSASASRHSTFSGFGGDVAPPFHRFYAGGEHDLRGFDIRSVTPYAFVPHTRAVHPHQSRRHARAPRSHQPDARHHHRAHPRLRHRLRRRRYQLHQQHRIPHSASAAPSPSSSLTTSAWPWPLRQSQLRRKRSRHRSVERAALRLPRLRQRHLPGRPPNSFRQYASGRWRAPTRCPACPLGGELDVMLPIVNAPFRIYYAYNPLRLLEQIRSENLITRRHVPCWRRRRLQLRAVPAALRVALSSCASRAKPSGWPSAPPSSPPFQSGPRPLSRPQMHRPLPESRPGCVSDGRYAGCMVYLQHGTCSIIVASS